jgi:hypothetical protein
VVDARRRLQPRPAWGGQRPAGRDDVDLDLDLDLDLTADERTTVTTEPANAEDAAASTGDPASENG